MEQLGRRLGDADRDAVATELLSHHLHGRLSLEELERRETAAHDAVYAADLVRLLVDLPGDTATMLPGAQPRHPLRLLSVPPVVRDRLLRYGTAPAAVTAGAALFAGSSWQFNSEDVFLFAVLNGALGIVTHAWAVRSSRPRP
jgi:hypothetical protein